MSEKKPSFERVSAIAPFGLRMLPELRDRIAEAAKANGRSMNSEIIRRLEQTFQFDKTEDRIGVGPPTAEGLQIAMDAITFLSGHLKDLMAIPDDEDVPGYDRNPEPVDSIPSYDPDTPEQHTKASDLISAPYGSGKTRSLAASDLNHVERVRSAAPIVKSHRDASHDALIEKVRSATAAKRTPRR